MPKDQYYKRLESLFSSPDTVPPEPANGKAAAPAETVDAAALQARVSELESALAKASESAAASESESQALRARLSDIETALARQSDEAAALRSRVHELETAQTGREAAAVSEADSLRRRIAELETALSTQTDEANLEADALRDRVAELETTLQHRAAALASEADSLRARLDELETALAARTTEAETLLARIVELQTALTRRNNEAAEESAQWRARVAELETAAAEPPAAPAPLQARIAELEERLAQEVAQSAAEAEAWQARIAELEIALAQAPAAPQTKASSADTGELKRTELALRQHEEDLAALLEFSPEAIGVVNTKTGLFESVNSGAEKLYGLSRAELLKVGPAEMSPDTQPDGRPSREKALEKIGHALHGERPVFEWMHRNAQGQNILCEVRLVGLAPPREHLVRFSVTDITERKHIEESLARRAAELEETRASLDAVIDNLPLMLFMKDAQDLRFVRFNKAGEEILGRPRDFMIGKSDADLLPADEARAALERDREVLHSGAVVEIPEEPIQTAHRGRRILHTRKLPIYGSDGRPRYLLGISEDITERKEAEEQLRLQASALATAANAVVITNRDGVIEWVNPAFTKFTGYAFEEAVGQHTRLLKSGAHDAEFYRNLWQTLVAGHTWHGEIINRRKDGSLYYEDQTISPVKDEHGHITHFVAVKQDVTSRHETDDAVRASEAIFRRTIEVAGAVPYRRDHRSNQYLYMGEGIRDILGYDAKEMTTDLLESLVLENVPFGEARDLDFSDAVQRARGGQFKQWRSDLLLRTRDGGTRWVADASIELIDESGQSTGSIGFLQDITDRKLAEQAMARRAEQLTALNRVVVEAASSFDTTHILGVAAREIALQLRARNCGIAVFDPARTCLTVVAEHTVGEESSSLGVVIPLEGNLSTRRVIETRRPILIDEAQSDPLTAPIHDLMRARNTHALLIVPLMARNEVVGTIGVDSTDPERKFSLDDASFVETIAGQIAGAMENARLFTESQRRATELATVADVSVTAASVLDPDELLQQLVDLTKNRFNLYHAHIYLLDASGHELVLTAGAGKVGRTMVADGRRIPVAQEQSLVARAARTRQGVSVNDVTLDPGFLPNPLLPNTRSEMAVPMIVGERLLGVLDVQSDQVNRFTDDDIRIQSTLAAQAAVALQNARQYQETQKALAELDSLTRRLTREGWQDYAAARSAALSFAYDLNEIRPASAEELNFNGHALIEHPLTVRGEPIGRLAVAEAEAIDEEAADIVAAVAERLSTHVDNLRLLEETERSRLALDRRAAELEAIARVSAAASTILERDQLLQTVVDLTKTGLNLYHSHIYLYDEVTESLVLAAGAGEVGRRMAAAGHAISYHRQHSLVARAARTRQGVISNDVSKEPDFLPNPYLPDTRSELAVPLIVGDRLLGVFDAQSDQPGFFTEEDVRTKTTLAEQVAVALQNAELYAEQAQTVERLRELDQLKSSFLANMSHELRTPLNSILGFAQVMLEGIDGDINQQMENDLSIIQKNGQHLLNLISDILDMAKIEAGKMTLNPEIFDLKEVLDEVTDLTGPLARAKSLDIGVDLGELESLDIYADRVRLRQVMINIVNNAIKFTETGGIAVAARRHEAKVRITVKDTGIGIPPSHLESIFQEFTQVDTSTTRKAGGTGLGLPISRHLVEMHGGRLWAESTGVPGEGSTFIIELPVETTYVQ